MSDDSRLAERLAVAAGELLLDLRRTSGCSGRELGALGDRTSNDLLLRMLSDEAPGDAVLSEESADSPQRLDADRVWIIDPLDGTREYGLVAEERTDWAVHIALWERAAGPEGGLTVAAVGLPALGAVHSTRTPLVATGGHARRELRFLVSESRPPAWAAAVAGAMTAELVPMGSAGAKAMAVLRGEFDAYLHDGGQWEWDSAAPVGVVSAAGVHASRVDGSPLLYNRPHPHLPDLLVCRPDLAPALLDAIAVARSGS